MKPTVLPSIFDTCVPRPDVLSGELTEAMFAAQLRSVVEGTADKSYQDPNLFLQSTFPTQGLRILIREVLGRLTGADPTANPFIRLETAFGGGKTHNLIALYHLARGGAVTPPPALVPVELLPKGPIAVAGVVGTDLDPVNGMDHGAVRTWTLWGEIAYQLGKSRGRALEAYEIVRASDEQRIAPGTQILEALVGNEPALFLLDELARHLRAAQEFRIPGGQGSLADQVVAFLQTLIEFAASQRHVVVVLTLADQMDAFAPQTEALQEAVREAQAITARQERVLVPTGEAEISRIVAHRLFAEVDRQAAREVAEAFLQHFRFLDERGAELPPRCLSSDYADEMAADYPFHPELLRTLSWKTATIPSFNRTRGALRLLARVVRRLWRLKPPKTHLISVHHLDLSDEDILNDLTSRLDRAAFRMVAEADIASPLKGTESKAQVLDRTYTEAGKPPYASRVATNVFLHSLTQGTATGAEFAEILASVLEPGDDPHLIRKVLATMLGEEKGPPGTIFWYLHWDGTRYRFKTEPSLEKVIQDEIPHVGKTNAKKELEERIQKVWPRSTFKPVFFPSEAGDLDDDYTQPLLAILHYDAVTVQGTSPAPPELVLQLFRHSGSMEGFRTYKNNLLFLVADRDQVDRMVEVALRHKAIKRLSESPDRLAQFSEEQIRKLKTMGESSEMDVRIAITRAYRHLFYPSADAPRDAEGLAHHLLQPQEQGEISSDQSAVLLRVLRGLEKVLTAEDPELSPEFVKAKAWPHGQESWTTLDLRKEFSKRLSLKILLDLNQLKKTIRNGCKKGIWVYYSTREQLGYGPSSPPPLVEISDADFLFTPEEAKRKRIALKGDPPVETRCPLCGQEPCICRGPSTCPRCGQDPCVCPAPLLRFQLEGTPGEVFQEIADRFHDAGALRIGRMTLRKEGSGRQVAHEIRSLGLVIPQLGRAQVRVQYSLNSSFQGEAREEHLMVEFTGGKDRYMRIKNFTDSFAKEANQVTGTLELELVYQEGLSVEGDEFASLKDLLVQMGLGTLVVSVEEEADRRVDAP